MVPNRATHHMCLGKVVDDDKVLNFNDLYLQNRKEVEILGIKIEILAIS